MQNKSEERHSVVTMMECPKFASCSAPLCPLDSLRDSRDYIRGEAKCNLSKKVRNRIGKEAGLEFEGMTRSEWVAQQRWSGMSGVEKKRRTAHLKQFSFNRMRIVSQ